MLNRRLSAAHAVRDAYLPLKQSTDQIATQATECLLTLQRARVEAGMPLGTGAEPIADVARGAALLFEAQQCFARAHPKLASIIDDAGLGRFFAAGADECPKEAMPFFTGGSLSEAA